MHTFASFVKYPVSGCFSRITLLSSNMASSSVTRFWRFFSLSSTLPSLSYNYSSAFIAVVSSFFSTKLLLLVTFIFCCKALWYFCCKRSTFICSNPNDHNNYITDQWKCISPIVNVTSEQYRSVIMVIKSLMNVCIPIGLMWHQNGIDQ